MRKIILAILGVLFIVGTIFFGNYLVDKNQKPRPTYKKTIKSVFVEAVKNGTIPIILSANGSLTAKNKIEIFSEVQGILKPSNKAFKAGTTYQKGEVLLRMNSDEFYASLQSQKSNLFNLITSIMPDLRLDYPNEFTKWQTYLQGFSMDNTTPKIPEFTSDKEKYFISGKGVLTAYYNVKNLEVRLAKHTLKAPFTGILTEAVVSPGMLVRIGQKLGEFIDPTSYEMEVSINAEFADLLKVGNTVTLTNLEKSKKYTGKVVRINGKVDQVSQTIKAYLDVKHPDLKEGMYLEANLVAKSESDALEIPRKLLVNNNAVYIVKNDTLLSLVPINPVYFGAEKVIIKGLENNTKLVSQTLPGAFDGMVVSIHK